MRILIAPLTAMFCHGTVGAQGLTRVMSGYAAISGPHAVLWVARDTGLFEKNGLRSLWIISAAQCRRNLTPVGPFWGINYS